jgi:hypothetical protein
VATAFSLCRVYSRKAGNAEGGRLNDEFVITSSMNEPEKVIPLHGGYRKLKSFQVAQRV